MTIKQKQCILYILGYYKGNIDGVWGDLSKTATTAFQKDFGIEDDGVFGAETEKAARHAVAFGMPAKKEPSKPTAAKDWWVEIEYFKKEEFACKCGGKYCKGYPAEMNEKVVKVADRTRKYFGATATVSSGLRCAKHNTAVGGVSNSRHKLGKAMDFCIAGKSAAQVLAYVQKQPEIRYAYAINDKYVHMDVE